MITPLPQKEGMTLEDHQEVLLHKNVKLIALVGPILPVMMTLLAKMAMGMPNKFKRIY